MSLLIFADDTSYPNDKNNLGELLVVKVPFASISDYSDFQPMVTPCEITQVEKASIYGEYRNQLSLTGQVVRAEDSIEL
ncbi:hypothetical protein [Streptococcus sp. sy004]|uniref:hypothetical protein n=1 Tax=Streptococcus sp. sy004 TaxID=2600149 RepID=UPI0021BD1CED|nr:hypothetical protein [Streptococcus sp. sy004]